MSGHGFVRVCVGESENFLSENKCVLANCPLCRGGLSESGMSMHNSNEITKFSLFGFREKRRRSGRHHGSLWI